MALNCSTIVNEYVEIFRAGFDILSIHNGCRIVTPNFKPDGTAIEIVVEQLSEDLIRLSDEYQTVDYLFLNGLDIENNKNIYAQAEAICNLRGVALQRGEIQIVVGTSQIAEALDKMLDAIEAVTYLIYRKSRRQLRQFSDEVQLFLTQKNLFVDTNYTLQGALVNHSPPIFINSSKNMAISPLSTTSVSVAKKAVGNLAFMVLDVKSLNPHIQFAAILDDRKTKYEVPWQNEYVRTILEKTLDHTTFWGERESLVNFLNVFA